MISRIKQLVQWDKMKPKRFVVALLLILLLVIGAVLLYEVLKPEEKPPIAEGTTSAEIEELRKTDFNALPVPERYAEYLRLGQLYEDGKAPQQARETYLLASQLDPAKTDFVIWQGLIRVTKLVDNSSQDIKVYGEKVVSIVNTKKNKLPADYITLAEGYEATGSWSDAVIQYKKFLSEAKFADANPDDPEPVGFNVFPTSYKTAIEQKIQQLESGQ